MFGYGDKFIHMVEDAFKNIQSKIKILSVLLEESANGVYSPFSNFSKSQALWGAAYKNRIDQPGEIKWSTFPLKY